MYIWNKLSNLKSVLMRRNENQKFSLGTDNRKNSVKGGRELNRYMRNQRKHIRSENKLGTTPNK